MTLRENFVRITLTFKFNISKEPLCLSFQEVIVGF